MLCEWALARAGDVPGAASTDPRCTSIALCTLAIVSDTEVVKVGPKGRIVIPARMRDRFGIDEGDELVVVADADSIQVIPRHRLVASLRGSLRADGADGADLVAELLADRRRDAAAGR